VLKAVSKRWWGSIGDGHSLEGIVLLVYDVMKLNAILYLLHHLYQNVTYTVNVIQVTLYTVFNERAAYNKQNKLCGWRQICPRPSSPVGAQALARRQADAT